MMAVMSVWPLIEIYEMPKYIPGDMERTMNRQRIWSVMQQMGAIAFMGAAIQGISFVPFHTDEVEYDYLKKQHAISQTSD